jgi:hypothetical protein
LTVAVPTHTMQVTYWLDDEMLATVDEAPFDYWWSLLSGEHDLHAVVLLEDGSSITTDSTRFRVGAWVPPDERPTSGVISE